MPNGTLDYPYEDTGTPVSVIIPSILVPIAVLFLLCFFCYWLNKKSPDIVSAKPHTYQDFSRVDDTTALRMSGELIENAISNDSLNADDKIRNTECSSGDLDNRKQDNIEDDSKNIDRNSTNQKYLQNTDQAIFQNGKNHITYSELEMTAEIK